MKKLFLSTMAALCMIFIDPCAASDPDKKPLADDQEELKKPTSPRNRSMSASLPELRYFGQSSSFVIPVEKTISQELLKEVTSPAEDDQYLLIRTSCHKALSRQAEKVKDAKA